MAVTSFSYASISDLQNYFNEYASFDKKTPVRNWHTTDVNNMYQSNDTGLISLFFFDGIEGTSLSDDPNADYEFNYSSSTNSVQVFHSSKDPNDMIVEAGEDFTDFINQQLVNASLELNSYLDARFPTPLPKNTQISESATSGVTSEYDPLIIKMTCYICASNLIRSKSPMDERADYYMNMVTNTEGTGFADRLSKGEYKLSFEVDKKDDVGSIRKITQTGTMQLVETSGEFVGGNNGYDLIRITCTDAGAYGVAKCKVEYYGSDKLFGSETTGHIVSGTLDSWSGLGGLAVRFSGASMSVSDQWEIECFSAERQLSNPIGGGTITMVRGGMTR